jgi:short-subunit dehydrogenase
MKTILITGATSGLGLLLSRYYDSKGFNLLATGRDKKKLILLKKELSTKNKNNCFSFDFKEKKNYEKFLKVIYKQSNKIDVIIHCLGGGFGLHSPNIGQDELNFLFNINVSSAVGINKLVLDKKKYNKDLRIIHIGSVASVEATASVGYSMVKASLIAYTKTLAKFLIKKNIFVHCVLLGAFEYENNAFERLKKKNKKIYNQFIKHRLPGGKIANGESFLGLFDFLISSNGDPLTGSSTVADFSETNSFRI